VGRSVEQGERVAEVPRVGGREAVGEGVEEVLGGGRVVGEAAGGGEERVELGRLAHGAGGSAMATRAWDGNVVAEDGRLLRFGFFWAGCLERGRDPAQVEVLVGEAKASSSSSGLSSSSPRWERSSSSPRWERSLKVCIFFLVVRQPVVPSTTTSVHARTCSFENGHA
jgi:hypothetical protein